MALAHTHDVAAGGRAYRRAAFGEDVLPLVQAPARAGGVPGVADSLDPDAFDRHEKLIVRLPRREQGDFEWQRGGARRGDTGGVEVLESEDEQGREGEE
jgi:hypothetical protein